MSLDRQTSSRTKTGCRGTNLGISSPEAMGTICCCLLRGNLVDIDISVGRSSEEDVAISGPRERSDPGELGNVLAWLGDAVDDSLGLEVPDLNAVIGGSAEPVVLGRERQGVDGGSGGQRVQVLAFVDVPEHSSSVLATRGDEGSIRGDGQGVDDTVVTNEVSSKLAVGQIPDLDDLVPTSRNNQRLLGGRRETNAGDPVVMLVLLDGVLALTQGVPELDGLVTTGRDDLSVVSRETDREDIALVGDEGSDRLTLIQVPESQSLIPRSRKSVSSIGRENDIGDGAVVAAQSLTGIAVGFTLRGELPDDDLLVTGRSDNGVGVSEAGSNSSDAVSVSLQVSSVDQLNHFDSNLGKKSISRR